MIRYFSHLKENVQTDVFYQMYIHLPNMSLLFIPLFIVLQQ